MVGMFARLTLKKDFVTGTITVDDAAYIPTYVFKRTNKATPRFTVVPAYTDPTLIDGLNEPLDDKEIDAIQRARALGEQRFGAVEGVRLIEDPVRPPQEEPETP